MNEHSKPGRARRLGVWLLVALPAALITARDTRAAGAQIDQANEVFTSRMSRNIDGLGPIGQEFRPELRKLNMVELFVDDASCSADGGPGAELKVRIRRGSIQGDVIAESPAVVFPNCFAGILRFEFAKDVKVAPGNTHVIELVPVAGQASAYGNDRGSTYPRGRQIIQGVPHEDKDLWFREGLVHARDKWWQ
jgi:hypothetical protein